MNIRIRTAQSLAITLILILSSAATAAPENKAGKIKKFDGQVWIERQKQLQKLGKGDAVFSGSKIKTGPEGSVTIRFSDKTIFSLGPNSEMLINTYKYDKKSQNNSLATRILKGSFRFISGLIAKKKPTSMNVNLGSVATIGIRGTHVIGEVKERQESADGSVVEESAKVILMEPKKKNRKTAIQVSNEYGSVFIDKPGYGTEIPDEHSPPKPIRQMQVRTINNVMRAIRSSTRTRTPKPRIP